MTLQTPRAPWICAALALAATACSGGGSSTTGSGNIDNKPRQFEPSEPGLLSIGPVGLVLETTDIKNLVVTLTDSLGQDKAIGDVEWTTETPSILEVSPDGTLVAKSAGTGVVTARDDGGRLANMTVDVVEQGEQPTGPVAIRFNSPVMNLEVGTSRLPVFDLTDANGEIVPPPLPTVRLAVEGGTVEIAEDGQLLAVEQGLSSVTAVLVGDEGEETPLDGQLLVAVFDPAVVPATEEECEWRVGGARFYRPPVYYSRPGLTGELRVLVYELQYCTGGTGIQVNPSAQRVRQRPPADVRIEDTNVVAINAEGLLESRGPGRTDVTGVMLEDDGTEVRIPSFDATAMPDLGGTWCIVAPNGDRGRLTLPAAPTLVEKREDNPRLQLGPRIRLNGTSELSDDSGSQVCSGAAGIQFDGMSVTGACSTDNPGQFGLVFQGVTYCGQERHAAQFPSDVFGWACTGPTSLRHNNGVELIRGDACSPEGEAPVGEDFASFRFDGMLIQDPVPVGVTDGSGGFFLDFHENDDVDNDTTWNLGMILTGVTTPGAYVLSNDPIDNPNNSADISRLEPFTSYHTGSGFALVVEVLEVDGNIMRGTFQGMLMDFYEELPPVTISEGSFRVTLTTEE